MKKKLNKKGISLIVLVITIIIMIIIAAAIILSLNSAGIIGRANKAREDSDIASKKYAATVALAEYDLLVNSNDTSVDGVTATEYVRAKLTAQGIVASDVTITESRQIVIGTTVVSKQWTLTTDSNSNGKPDVGDLITSKKKTTEQFYVIGIDGDTVSMLAKYNLKSDGSEQDTGADNVCVFSSTNYWSSYSGSYPLNLNDYEIPSTATSIVTTAKAYGETLDVETGRLMTLEEICSEDIGGDSSNHTTSSCPSFINTQIYWLGSASGNGRVWFVYGIEDSDLRGDYYYDDGIVGVRPVIEVSSSSIE